MLKFGDFQDNLEKSGPSVGDISSTKCNTCLLTPGRAWAVSLNLRSTLHEEIVKTCFPNHAYETDENLLYRFAPFPYYLVLKTQLLLATSS